MDNRTFRRRRKSATLAAAALATAARAWAEAPMNTDDAGTLARRGVKIEGLWARDDRADAGALAFAFGPAENLELGISAERGRDAIVDPALRQRGLGLGVKWVPYQNPIGLSFGARLDYARTRVEDRGAGVTATEREAAVTALATYRRRGGQVLHANLGATRFDAGEGKDTVGTWSIGIELPLAASMQLTLETFGAERTRPDRAAGLRYELEEGLKLSGAVGTGSDRSFGQFGLAWEF